MKCSRLESHPSWCTERLAMTLAISVYVTLYLDHHYVPDNKNLPYVWRPHITLLLCHISSYVPWLCLAWTVSNVLRRTKVFPNYRRILQTLFLLNKTVRKWGSYLYYALSGNVLLLIIIFAFIFCSLKIRIPHSYLAEYENLAFCVSLTPHNVNLLGRP